MDGLWGAEDGATGALRPSLGGAGPGAGGGLSRFLSFDEGGDAIDNISQMSLMGDLTITPQTPHHLRQQQQHARLPSSRLHSAATAAAPEPEEAAGELDAAYTDLTDSLNAALGFGEADDTGLPTVLDVPNPPPALSPGYRDSIASHHSGAAFEERFFEAAGLGGGGSSVSALGLDLDLSRASQAGGETGDVSGPRRSPFPESTEPARSPYSDLAAELGLSRGSSRTTSRDVSGSQQQSKLGAQSKLDAAKARLAKLKAASQQQSPAPEPSFVTPPEVDVGSGTFATSRLLDPPTGEEDAEYLDSMFGGGGAEPGASLTAGELSTFGFPETLATSTALLANVSRPFDLTMAQDREDQRLSLEELAEEGDASFLAHEAAAEILARDEEDFLDEHALDFADTSAHQSILSPTATSPRFTPDARSAARTSRLETPGSHQPELGTPGHFFAARSDAMGALGEQDSTARPRFSAGTPTITTPQSTAAPRLYTGSPLEAASRHTTRASTHSSDDDFFDADGGLELPEVAADDPFSALRAAEARLDTASPYFDVEEEQDEGSGSASPVGREGDPTPFAGTVSLKNEQAHLSQVMRALDATLESATSARSYRLDPHDETSAARLPAVGSSDSGHEEASISPEAHSCQGRSRGHSDADADAIINQLLDDHGLGRSVPPSAVPSPATSLRHSRPAPSPLPPHAAPPLASTAAEPLRTSYVEPALAPAADPAARFSSVALPIATLDSSRFAADVTSLTNALELQSTIMQSRFVLSDSAINTTAPPRAPPSALPSRLRPTRDHLFDMTAASTLEPPPAIGDLSAAIFGAFNKGPATAQTGTTEPILSEEEERRLARQRERQHAADGQGLEALDLLLAAASQEVADDPEAIPRDSSILPPDDSLAPALLEDGAAAELTRQVQATNLDQFLGLEESSIGSEERSPSPSESDRTLTGPISELPPLPHLPEPASPPASAAAGATPSRSQAERDLAAILADTDALTAETARTTRDLDRLLEDAGLRDVRGEGSATLSLHAEAAELARTGGFETPRRTAASEAAPVMRATPRRDSLFETPATAGPARAVQRVDSLFLELQASRRPAQPQNSNTTAASTLAGITEAAPSASSHAFEPDSSVDSDSLRQLPSELSHELLATPPPSWRDASWMATPRTEYKGLPPNNGRRSPEPTSPAAAAAAAADAGPRVTVHPGRQLLFPLCTTGAQSIKELRVDNDSGERKVVRLLARDPAYFQVPATDTVLEPFCSETIAVGFTPARAGTTKSQLTIRVELAEDGPRSADSLPAGSIHWDSTINVQGAAEPPALRLDPPAGLDFGVNAPNVVRERAATLRNDGSAGAVVRLRVVDDAGGVFGLVLPGRSHPDGPDDTGNNNTNSSDSGGGPTPECSLTLPPGGSQVFRVAFQPRPGAGLAGQDERFKATLTVAVGGVHGPVLLSAGLSGGVGFAKLHVPKVLEQMTLCAPAGGSVERTIPLRNGGTVATAVQLETDEGEPALSVHPSSITLEPSEIGEARVVFAPRPGHQQLKSRLRLTLVPQGTVYHLNVDTVCQDSIGRGAPAPVLLCNRRFLCFGGVEPGSTATQALRLRNNSPDPLTLRLFLLGDPAFAFADAASRAAVGSGSGAGIKVRLAAGQDAHLDIACAPTALHTCAGRVVIVATPSGATAASGDGLDDAPVTGADRVDYQIPLVAHGGRAAIEVHGARAGKQRLQDGVLDLGRILRSRWSLIRVSLHNSGSTPGFAAITCQDGQGMPLDENRFRVVPPRLVLAPGASQHAHISFMARPADSGAGGADDPGAPSAEEVLANLNVVSGDEVGRSLLRRHLEAHGHLDDGLNALIRDLGLDEPFAGEAGADGLSDEGPEQDPAVAHFYSLAFAGQVSRQRLCLVSANQPPTPGRAARVGSGAQAEAGAARPTTAAAVGYRQPATTAATATSPVGASLSYRSSRHTPHSPSRPAAGAGRLNLSQSGSRSARSETTIVLTDTPHLSVSPERLVFSADDGVATRTLTITNLGHDPTRFVLSCTAHALHVTPQEWALSAGERVEVQVTARSIAAHGLPEVSMIPPAVPWSGLVSVCFGRERLPVPVHVDERQRAPQSGPELEPGAAEPDPRGAPVIHVKARAIAFAATPARCCASAQLEFRNLSSSVPYTWLLSSSDPPLVKTQSRQSRSATAVFGFQRQSGTVPAGGAVAIPATFAPMKPGRYSQAWELRFFAQGQGASSRHKQQLSLGLELQGDATAGSPDKPRDRGVYCLPDVLHISGATGSTTSKKIKICNGSDTPRELRFACEGAAFLVRHETVRLRPYSYVQLPVRFRPADVGAHRGALLISVLGDGDIEVPLHGVATLFY